MLFYTSFSAWPSLNVTQDEHDENRVECFKTAQWSLLFLGYINFLDTISSEKKEGKYSEYLASSKTFSRVN